MNRGEKYEAVRDRKKRELVRTPGVRVLWFREPVGVIVGVMSDALPAVLREWKWAIKEEAA